MSEEKQSLFQQAFDLWESFKDEIMYKNRFIVEHTILDFVKKIAEDNKKIFKKDTILYRARIFNGDDSFLPYLNYDSTMHNNDSPVKRLSACSKKAYIEFKRKSGFWGYNEEESFVPKDKNLAGEGRANPAFIKYLYAAGTPYTALAEVRPYLGAEISVAEIIITQELTIADFSYQGFKISDDLEEKLMCLIMFDFSEPINTNKKDYIPTQYIAEYLKKLGYDGIKFNSSLDSYGSNITIFNYDKCKAISSKLYKVKDIYIDSNCIAPMNEQELSHKKLKSFKDSLKKPLLLKPLKK